MLVSVLLIKVVPKIVVEPLIAFVPPATPIVLAAVVPVPKVLVKEVPVPIVEAPDEVKVVNAPVDGVPEPIAPGAAKVAPFKEEALRFATLVVDAITNGAVPVASVEVNCPDILIDVIPERAPAFMTKLFIVLVEVGAVIAPERVSAPDVSTDAIAVVPWLYKVRGLLFGVRIPPAKPKAASPSVSILALSSPPTPNPSKLSLGPAEVGFIKTVA